MKLTIIITKGEEFFISSIKEIPAVLSQGETIEEAKRISSAFSQSSLLSAPSWK